jgi:cold shock CspA family protein
MSKGRETFGKKDIRSKKEKKRKEKELKRIERKANKGSGSPEGMIAYVDEFGNITSNPPDLTKRETINAEDIQIAVPRNVQLDLDDMNHVGIVKFFDNNRGFGFITDSGSKQDIFFHASGVIDSVKEGNKVTFKVVKGINGLNAVHVEIDRT